MDRQKKIGWMALSVMLILALDQWSKHASVVNLIDQPIKRVFSWLNMSLAFNTGAAFSMLADGGLWSRYGLAVLAIAVTIGLLVWWWREAAVDRWLSLSVGLLIGGALGNLVDRIRYGMVVDFIDVHWKTAHFATFNVADSAVSAGIVLLLWRSYLLRNQDCSK